MNPLRQVRGGDSFRPSAQTQNALLSAADMAGRQRDFGSSAAPEREEAQVLIQAAADLARFAPFSLGAVVTTPAADSQFQRLPVFASAAAVADKPFGVMLDPAKAGSLGRGILCGMVPALVTMLDATHQYARINATPAIESAATGYARIIWAAGTSGSQWCLLQVPGGSDATVSPQVQLRSTGANVPAQGKPYKLGTAEGAPTLATLAAGPVFALSATFTDGDAFVIALASGTGANAVAAVASGVVPALVTMSATGATDKYADIVGNVLTSAPTGYARIMWQAGTSGNVLCLLALAAGAAPVNAIIDFRVNKTTHTLQVKRVNTPAWTDLPDDTTAGGILEPGVHAP